MKISKDQNDNSFVKIGNIRITYVKAATRKKSKRWTDEDCLRFNAYVNPDQNDRLYPGAEIALGKEPLSVGMEIINAVIMLLRDLRAA